MPDRSKVMTTTKRDTRALQFGGWAWGFCPIKFVKKLKQELRKNEIKAHQMLVVLLLMNYRMIL